MKTLFLLLLVVTTAHAQQLSVRFYGPANLVGLPDFWPKEVVPGMDIRPGFVQLTTPQLSAIVATNQAAYTAWESNHVFSAKSEKEANIARLFQLYAGIPNARTQFIVGVNLLATVDGSLASGTNTQAQVVGRLRQVVAVETEAIGYLDNIAEILDRLGPLLKDMYNATQRTTLTPP